jgi:outer membrane immunogenic protein
MKTILTGLGAAAISTMMATAVIADGGSYGSVKDDPVVSMPNWSGGYFGGHIGYGAADSTVTENLPTLGPLLPSGLSSTYDADGFIGGLQIGARRQFGSMVLGVELAGTGSGIEGSGGDCFGIETLAGGLGAPPGLIGSRCTTEANWLATLSGRAGVAFDKYMVYGVLGWSVASVTHTHTISAAIPGLPIALNGSQNDIMDGIAFGVGGEWAFAPGMSVALEYMRHDLKSESAGLLLGGILTTGTRDLELDTITTKLNVRF